MLPMPPINGGRHMACEEPYRFDYAAGRKQRREAILAAEAEGKLLESEKTKPQLELLSALPPKRTPRRVVSVGMLVP